MADDKAANDQIDEFYIQALLLSKVVKRILKRKAEIDLTNEPVFEVKPITEFMKRMRVNGLAKFDDKTYISTVNFYQSEADQEKQNAVGVIISYVPEPYIVSLLRAMEYPVIDEDDEEALEDACGTFCNLIAGNFKSGLTQLGYSELIMSHFSSYQNSVVNGVEYPYGQESLYEVSFEIRGEKSIVFDVSLGPLSKVDLY